MEQKVFGKVLCQLLVTNGLSAYAQGKIILFKSHYFYETESEFRANISRLGSLELMNFLYFV